MAKHEERNAEILRDRRSGLKFREIAAKQGITVQRAQHIYSEADFRLRNPRPLEGEISDRARWAVIQYHRIKPEDFTTAHLVEASKHLDWVARLPLVGKKVVAEIAACASRLATP